MLNDWIKSSSEAVKESGSAGGTACATSASAVPSMVRQAVPPASPAGGRFLHRLLTRAALHRSLPGPARHVAYTERMSGAICETRRPRRFCPGVRGDICTVCCGAEREVTVNCPLDCEFLLEARKHDRVEPFNPEVLPNPDIRLSRKDLQDNEDLLLFLVRALVAAAMGTSGAVDLDVREALEALIRTYRTLQNGVYYESVPENSLAANIYRIVHHGLAQIGRA